MTGPGRLTGVGVGPGDPELVTVKGVRVLREADVVFVPVSADGGPGYAEGVVLAHEPGHLVRLPFALGDDDPAARQRSWDEAGHTVAAVVADGGYAAFATIGDPNLYSTFTYLAQTVRTTVPDVLVSTIPGITAFQDLAARSGTLIAEGTESVCLLPITAGTARLTEALTEHDTVIAYKGGRRLAALRAAVAAAGRGGEAVYGSRLGLDGEVVGPLADDDVAPTGAGPYLTTVLVTRPRGSRGGRL